METYDNINKFLTNIEENYNQKSEENIDEKKNTIENTIENKVQNSNNNILLRDLNFFSNNNNNSNIDFRSNQNIDNNRDNLRDSNKYLEERGLLPNTVTFPMNGNIKNVVREDYPLSTRIVSKNKEKNEDEY